MSDDLFHNLYEKPQPPKPKANIVRRLLAMLCGKLGISIAATAIWGMLSNSGAIMGGFRAVCAVIGLMGDPEVHKKATNILATAETKVETAPPVVTANILPPVAPDSPEPITPVPAPDRHKPTPKERFNKFVDPAKKTIEKNAKELGDKAENAKEELKVTANNVADTLGNKIQAGGVQTAPVFTPGGTPPALPGQTRDPGQQVSGIAHDVSNIASGTANSVAGKVAGFHGQQVAVKKATTDEQQARLAPIRELYNIWWAERGPNGLCPNCRRPMNVSRAGKGVVKCPIPRCGVRSHADVVRLMGAPRIPAEPPPAFYVWKQARDEAAARAAKNDTPKGGL